MSTTVQIKPNYLVVDYGAETTIIFQNTNAPPGAVNEVKVVLTNEQAEELRTLLANVRT